MSRQGIGRMGLVDYLMELSENSVENYETAQSE